MKRRVTFCLVSMVCLLFMGIASPVFAEKAAPKVAAYIEVEQGLQKTVDVSLNIIPNNNMNISSMIFTIGYTYSYGDDYFNFTYNEENTANNLALDARFSEASVSNSHVYYDTFNYVWEASSPVSVTANELITLATISLDVADTAGEGEYIFTLDCSDFYCYEEGENTDTGSFTDAIVEISQDNYYFWLGEKMSANTSLFSIVASGTEEVSDIISVTKNVDANHCYITDTSIAEIVDIQNFDDGGAFISIVGKKVGTTTLVVKGGYQNIEEVFVTIKVVEPTPLFVNISSNSTYKSTYEPGETLDLTGLILRVTYNNNDVEYVTYSGDTASDFTIGEYNFSTAGSKRIEVTYGGRSVFVDVAVQAKEPDVLRGDMNGDGLVTDADAIYLLYFTFFSSDYPLNQSGDFNRDGIVTDADAIYLLYYTFFPSDYPL